MADLGTTARFVTFECADGRRVSVDHVPLGDNGSAGRLWTFRDITQFKLAEQEQREFLATMSHEIKTPLSGIAGAAELLCSAGLGETRAASSRRSSPTPRRRSAGSSATCSTSRAPRPAATRRKPPGTTRAGCSTSVAGVLRPGLRGRPLELLVEVDADVPDALHGDAARVRQIVLNLASNAVKYTESGHARIHARVDGNGC